MQTSASQLPGAGRHRGRYSLEFKRQVMATYKQPGVSTAAVASKSSKAHDRYPLEASSQRVDTIILLQYPVACAGECTAWMREVLK